MISGWSILKIRVAHRPNCHGQALLRQKQLFRNRNCSCRYLPTGLPMCRQVAAVATNAVAAVVSNVEPNVFPNPAVSGQNTTLQINSDKGGTAAVQVLSAMGNVVQAEQLSVAPGMNTENASYCRPQARIVHYSCCR